MLYLYRGWNSGTNEAVLQAWRQGSPEVAVTAWDAGAAALGTAGAKLKALPAALRRGGLRVLAPGRGNFGDAIKRSAWYMRRIGRLAERAQQAEHPTFSLAVGTLIPVLRPRCPHFVYTDLTIRANAYYADGDRHVERWRECLPYERYALRQATVVFTMSDHVTRSLTEQYGLPASRVVRVNGGCNAPPVTEVDPRRFERGNILFVGVDWERKGGEQVASAFAAVRRKHPHATLTIVGCRPKLSGPGIEVVGRVPPEQVPTYLARATCFCMPTRREAFGIAYLEAMRAGLPVVATDIGAIPDFVIDGETGYRVAPDDVTALAERLSELLADPDKSRRMGQCGQALINSQYTWRRTQRHMWLTIRQRLGLPAAAENAPAGPRAADAVAAEATTNQRVREVPSM